MGTEINPEPAQNSGLDVRGGIEKVPPENQFDCITMWHTLEHMRDIRSVLSQTARLLKPDGRLFIAVPDNGGFQANILGKKWIHLDVPRHLYHFDAGSLGYCLESAGYGIQRQWHEEFEYDLLGWSQSALNCAMRRQNVFFDFLIGKQKPQGRWITAFGFVLGAALTILALPAVAVGTVCRRGGTLVVVAHKCREELNA
jgi:SAM-dependent methyltransferase